MHHTLRGPCLCCRQMPNLASSRQEIVHSTLVLETVGRTAFFKRGTYGSGTPKVRLGESLNQESVTIHWIAGVHLECSIIIQIRRVLDLTSSRGFS